MRTADQTIQGFCDELAANTPAPGGGTAAAVTGAVGAALVAMVAGLTFGKERYAAVQPEMADLMEASNQEEGALLRLADEDRNAFDQVMAAFAMPKATTEEKAARQQAIQAAYRQATIIPLDTMRHALAVMRGAHTAAALGNPNALSDAYAGYLSAAAAFEGALWNVAINLGSIKDDAFKQETLTEVDRLRAEQATVAAALQSLTPDPIACFVKRG